MLRFATLALLATTVSASGVPSLTPDNYDKLTEGKTVFLKFFAPWVSQVFEWRVRIAFFKIMTVAWNYR